MTNLERSLTYLEAQVKYLMQRDAEREGSAMAKPSLTTDPVTNALATLSAYNAAHPDAPMTWWPGGDKAPEDWDGGKVLFKTGVTGNVAGRWPAIIGYHQKAEAPEPAADLVVKVAEAFCAWPLPENFNPDGGIHFDGWIGNPGTKYEFRRQLMGTNLIGLSEAVEMVHWLLERTGLRLVRDLSEEERDSLATKVCGVDTHGLKQLLTKTIARAAIDAVLGPVKP